ncbi:MAG: hypothetical protein DDT25_00001 [Chloroflexi bacterium]|nr:hypothetical protein [Chloroflexota bacterium]
MESTKTTDTHNARVAEARTRVDSAWKIAELAYAELIDSSKKADNAQAAADYAIGNEKELSDLRAKLALTIAQGVGEIARKLEILALQSEAELRELTSGD